MSERHDTDLSSAIAIVGMAGRFPGSRNVRQFWRNLRDGVESIRFFGRQELLERGVPARAVDDPNYVPANGFVDDIDLFDADFFGIPPREAEIMDPQHRFLLECAWEVLEDAGYVPENSDARIGLIAGVGASSYLIRNILPNQDRSRLADELNLLMGNSKDFAVTRIAYKLDLRGPALNVNTACSSGLVAVHLACQSLIDFQCDVALAGGVGIQVPQDTGYMYQLNSIASPDGHCRAFDASAAGTVHGNGVGLVALRRLEDAVADRDHIYAILLGSAVNNDGAGKVGYTAPGCDGQARVIAEALSIAECDPETISYVEAHGTGTRLGDPVEMAALRRAFGKVARNHYCAIGSVKTNVGHLDEAAGVTGLIKTALALKHREIPASLHFQTPNPEIDFDGSPFFVNQSLTPWHVADGTPRRAGVSSFGIGGTNAHAVLQEAPSTTPCAASRPWQLLTLSARSTQALGTMAVRLAEVLESESEIDLAGAAFTLHTGRREFDHRMAVACQNRAEAVRSLREATSPHSATVIGTPPVAFLFSGQGSQYAGMGRELYELEPVFRDKFNDCAAILEECLGLDVRKIVFSSGGDANMNARLRDTQLAQPCLFAFEYALAHLWMSFGIKPAYMAGHSVGEYTAAHFAGLITLEDTLRLLAERGRLMGRLPEGSMLVVVMDAASLSPLLNGAVSIAAMNAPGLTVVAGETSAIAELESRVAEKAIACQRLATSHAFHSPMMGPMIPPFRTYLSRLPILPSRIPFVSNLTGEWIQPGEVVDADYWCRHLRQPVNFTGCLDRLAEIPDLILLEVGPGEALKTIAQRHPAWKRRRVLHSVRHPRVEEHDSALLLRTLGQLWTNGAAVDWSGFHAHEELHRVSLPTYSFEGKRYWIEEPRQLSTEKTAETFDDWLWTPRWEHSPPPPQNRALAAVPWLVFAPDDERTNEILYALREHSGAASLARIDSSSQASFGAELARHPQPRRVLYRAELGISGLLFLAQALGEMQWHDAELTILTEELHAVDGTEQLQPDHALVAGAAQTIPLELSVRCRTIDLGRNCPLDVLVRELGADARDQLVALRGAERFVRNFVQQPPEDSDGSGLRERGVYLITGGFGSMGLAFAKTLAKQVRARLVLVGRKGPPPREEWQKLLDEGPIALARNTLAQLQEVASANGASAAELDQYPGLREALHALCAAFIGDYLRSVVPLQRGDTVERRELAARLRVKPVYRRFFDGLLAMLVGDEYLREIDGALIVAGEIPRVEELLEPTRERFPEMSGAIRLLERCAGYYPAALSGEVRGIEALYPEGRPDFLNECARETLSYSAAASCLKRAAHVVRAFANARGSISILEVGGGNGDLTSQLIDVLDASRTAYHFTDISPTFVANARKLAEQRGLTYMDFGVLDVSLDPLKQGLKAQSYDVIAAYNVMHLAPDPSAALAHLRRLLKPGGMIVLGETLFLQRWDYMCWGLAEDLWTFPASRGESPFLSVTQWQTVLREAGFDLVGGFPDSPRDGDIDTALVFALDPNPDESYRRTRHLIECLREIEMLGSETILVSGDVADPVCLRGIIEQAHTSFGALNGIIHTAGILGQGMIRTRTAASVDAVLAPKVAPLRTLEKILGASSGDAPFDFLILCSSAAAIAPIVGQFDYAAANAWLDAFAHYASRRYGWRTISINWNFWQELGMIEHARSSAAEKEAILGEIRERGWTEAGVAVFSNIVSRFRGTQVLVSPRRLQLERGHRDISHSLLRERVELPKPLHGYSGLIGPQSCWEVGDHRPGGVPVLPGTAYLDLAVAAFENATGCARVQLHNVFFPAPMTFGESETREVRVVLNPSGGGKHFVVVSRAEGEADAWIEHAHGEIEAAPDDAPGVLQAAFSGAECIEFADQRDHPLVQRQGSYSPRWQSLERIEFRPDGLLFRAALPKEWADEAGSYHLHPALLDAIVGAAALCRSFEQGLPFSYGRVRIWSRLPASCTVYCCYRDVDGPDTFTVDLKIADAAGRICIEIENYTMRRIREIPASAAGSAVSDGKNQELAQHATGSLASLELRECTRIPPGPGQVEIEVYAAGLNFIEVLFALGMLPQFEGRTPARFGLECSGVITRVGSDVIGLVPGDEVMAFSESSFSRYTLADARAVRVKPQHLTFESAATIPAAYCTAWHALVTKARLKRGERVLIHSAAGGVGMAALQIAQWIGAEIFATAGSDEKRERLRELGAAHTMSSRTLDFADEVQRLTDGRGVDVVLNSLSGEFQSRSLECLAPYGRFLEVGKRDFASGRLLNLAPFAKKLSFFAIDVGTDLPDFTDLWTEVAAHVDHGDFGPLPAHIFPIADVATAFDFMAQAKHFGKIVIAMRDGADLAAAPRRRAARTFASILDCPLVKERDGASVQEPVGAVAAPRHARPALAAEFRSPASGSESVIAGIWEELLGIAPIGADDNFFELRGDSLLAAQVFSRLYRSLNVKLPLNAVFEAPTPAGLAALVEKQRAATASVTAPPALAAVAEEEGEL